MPIVPQEIREHLMASSTEFQRLASEHSQYESQLEQLSKQTYLNAEDLLLVTKLKKLKLRVKDEMEQLVARHSESQPVTMPGARTSAPLPAGKTPRELARET